MFVVWCLLETLKGPPLFYLALFFRSPRLHARPPVGRWVCCCWWWYRRVRKNYPPENDTHWNISLQSTKPGLESSFYSLRSPRFNARAPAGRDGGGSYGRCLEVHVYLFFQTLGDVNFHRVFQSEHSQRLRDLRPSIWNVGNLSYENWPYHLVVCFGCFACTVNPSQPCKFIHWRCDTMILIKHIFGYPLDEQTS